MAAELIYYLWTGGRTCRNFNQDDALIAVEIITPGDRFAEHRAHTDLRFSQMDAQIVASATGVKELFSSELRAFRAEILAALPQRARGASTGR